MNKDFIIVMLIIYIIYAAFVVRAFIKKLEGK